MPSYAGTGTVFRAVFIDIYLQLYCIAPLKMRLLIHYTASDTGNAGNTAVL
jgi:hypothetical protein